MLAGSELLARRERFSARAEARGGDGGAPSGSDEGWPSGEGGGLATLLLRLLRDSGYEAMVKGAHDGTAQSRWRNLGGLAATASPTAP